MSATRQKNRYFMKYQCKCKPPHNSIRSGCRPDGPNRLNIICKDCGQPFTCVEDGRGKVRHKAT